MRLTIPGPGRSQAETFVSNHLSHLVCDQVEGSHRFRGGQTAADTALGTFDVAGYSSRRNEVLPVGRRGASALSPYIRHGLLSLRDVWDHVVDGPSRDVSKYRDELLWQEYSRHLYARLGRRTSRGLRQEIEPIGDDEGWDRSMSCVAFVLDELETDGWLVNQTRMWMASEWTNRNGARWQDGEDEFFRHLLDGSRAANRLGWQWTTGVGSSKPYGFSRWQVGKRAPELCEDCEHSSACPIEEWPDDPAFVDVEVPVELGPVDRATSLAGPAEVERVSSPDVVWLTAESLGSHDAALVSNVELPVVFIFDEPLLSTLQLSAKRLVFLTETLAELATYRDLEVGLGRPEELLKDRAVAVTHAPVPGFVSKATKVELAELHPWPWLTRPTARSLRSFSAWRKGVRL